LVLTIAVAAQKGGAGKTTVTVHLAVAAMLADERVAIVDTDPQRTALAWAQTRGSQTPMVVATTRVDEAKREALSDGYTVLLIDTPPVAAATTTAYLRAADFVLVPLRPSAFDLTTLDQTLALVRAAQAAGAIVLNACPARAPEISEARALCADVDLPLAPVELGDRRAYSRAVQSGRAVQEFDPKGAAADEIARLWNYVHTRMTVHATR
jgi:chromosome partitioning protein